MYTKIWNIKKELRFCRKLWLSNHFIFTSSGYTDIGIRKFEFVAKNQFLYKTMIGRVGISNNLKNKMKIFIFRSLKRQPKINLEYPETIPLLPSSKLENKNTILTPKLSSSCFHSLMNGIFAKKPFVCAT